MRNLLSRLCLCGLPLLAATISTADVADLGKVDRRIAKEPTYNAEKPLYGLYVFGPEGKTSVWAVLDKSKPELDHYDILYFDRNADSDLTALDERIERQGNAQHVTFSIGAAPHIN
jgi:hypothetical protein